MKASITAWVVLITGFSAVFTYTDDARAAASRGLILSEQWCSQCHAVRPDQLSPGSEAPTFADVAAEPSVTDYSLRVFLKTPHATMPNFIIKPDDIDDIVSYIMSLKPTR